MRRVVKKLRRPMTPAERRLWSRLRAHRLAGLKFKRQVPIGRYVVDFYCAEHRLIVEVGGVSHVYAAIRDDERERSLVAMGHRVIHFGNRDIFQRVEDVLQAILSHTCGEGVPLSPVPSPLRGEGRSASLLNEPPSGGRAGGPAAGLVPSQGGRCGKVADAPSSAASPSLGGPGFVGGETEEPSLASPSPQGRG
ncbi:MAG: endonuclease domain-containing protein [Planctomycetes bacterium]|nr:endonuclease domain-containing protein [Planctomycetota bacterium]